MKNEFNKSQYIRTHLKNPKIYKLGDKFNDPMLMLDLSGITNLKDMIFILYEWYDSWYISDIFSGYEQIANGNSIKCKCTYSCYVWNKETHIANEIVIINDNDIKNKELMDNIKSIKANIHKIIYSIKDNRPMAIFEPE